MAAPIDGPPPTYESVAGGPSTAPHSTNQNTATSSAATKSSKTHLDADHAIPPQSRRSMEDEGRPLPSGWVRQFDSQSHHQFFVDTSVEPPRSIWHHPYDDETYISGLSPAERQEIHGLHRVPTNPDIIAAHSDDEDHHEHFPNDLPPRPTKDEPTGIHRFGRRMKDKITSTTHEEREKMREQRAKEEQAAYERHQKYRQAMARAIETGEPQLIGKDKEGKEVYIEPPSNQGGYGGYPGDGYNGGAYGQNGYGYNPYSQGLYGNPNRRYMRPTDPYSRPYYRGYGGGLGLPIGLGLGGGLLGAELLGGGMMGGGMMGGGMGMMGGGMGGMF